MGLSHQKPTSPGGESETSPPTQDTLGDSTFRPRLGNPRSVYIHIPFCRHRCGYCNFTLVAGRDYLIERFLSALETEIHWLDRDYEIDTLFLGGGTPSHLNRQQLGRLANIIGSRFSLAEDAEVTAECNPNDLDPARAAGLAEIGVNRISLGVQSLRPEKLARLERDHSVVDVENAMELARHFAASISLDLIFAAPEETLEQWQSDLEQAIALQPAHVSTYELTYEKGTRFWNQRARGNLKESDEDLRTEMYLLAIDQLEGQGREQYEVSSFARLGHQSRHNQNYWIGDPYFAFGPGAARFVDGVRESNHHSTMQYLKRIENGLSPVAEREQLDSVAAARERLAIGLRMRQGLNAAAFVKRTGHSIPAILGSLQETLIDNSLLSIPGEGTESENCNWCLTRKGLLVCDWIAAEIIGI